MTRAQTRLDGAHVLITGAASGIGKATAEAFARRGAKLIVTDIDEAGLDALRASLGANILISKNLDVADRQAMRAFADEVHAQIPALDVLVNNAGVAVHGGLLDTRLEDWDWLMGINLFGVIHGCHFFGPNMVRAGRGSIVNVSSTYGFIAGSRVLAYVTSKFGVFGLSEALRVELADKGLHVATICPGLIRTNIIDRARFDSETDRKDVAGLFNRRGAPPKAVAEAIVDAVLHKKDVVPVAPEAHFFYAISRLAPGLARKVVTLLDRPSVQRVLGR
ncbi:MAG TPA: SDR family NAD(P)-dependent oxidoreductase [Myxococcota bacterium]|nr:SDR family NAD(P)-dependent oxidoreductase [Myxococcota bacterium]